MSIDETKEQTYRVVTNHEEQYSIYAADRELPAGWSDAGKTGSRDECLAHIDVIWTDLRPLSLRTRTAGAVEQGAPSSHP